MEALIATNSKLQQKAWSFKQLPYQSEASTAASWLNASFNSCLLNALTAADLKLGTASMLAASAVEDKTFKAWPYHSTAAEVYLPLPCTVQSTILMQGCGSASLKCESGPLVFSLWNGCGSIRILLPFTLMRIRIQLLVRVIRTCDHWSTDPRAGSIFILYVSIQEYRALHDFILSFSSWFF